MNSILSFLLLYKYAALFFVTFISALIVPFPVSTVFLASGAFSSQGFFHLSTSIFVIVVANVLGDIAGYALARRYGTDVLRIFKIRVSPKFALLEEKIRRRSSLTVIITRFSAPLSVATNFVSGFAGVAFLNFFVSDLFGNLISDIPIIYGGYIAGSYWQDLSELIDTVGAILFVAVLIALIAIFFLKNGDRSHRT